MKNPTQTVALVILSIALSIAWGVALGYSKIHDLECTKTLHAMFSIPFHVALMTLYIASVCINFVLFAYMEEAYDNRGQVALWRRRAAVFIGLRISLLGSWMFVFFFRVKKDVFSSFVIFAHFCYVLLEMFGFIYAIMVDKATKFVSYYYASVFVQIIVSFLLLVITVFHSTICKEN